MKTVMYMATTPTGFIARSDGRTDFICDAEWDEFQSRVHEFGNVIFGRQTYEGLPNEEFDRFGDAQVLVVSGATNLKLQRRADVLVDSPAVALREAERRGMSTAFVCGGGALNRSFLEQGLVDELYLDIEPTLLGHGIPFCRPLDGLELPLTLIEVRQYGPNGVQLHYSVGRQDADGQRS
jgi:dihydrofolate reductase